MSSTYSNKSGSTRPKQIESPENFLEALKSLGKGTISEFKSQARSMVVDDIPDSFGFGKSGDLQPNQQIDMAEVQAAEERGYQKGHEDTARLRQMWETEMQQLRAQENQAKQQIQPLLAEIRELAKSMGNLAQEVQIATMQMPIHPGTYHKNFFAHLKSMISALRRQVDSSREWLAMSSKRSGKKGSYWSQVSTSGTKFMMSSERYMVTSTG